VIGSSQSPTADNTRQSQETDIHGTGGIGTHNPIKPVPTDPRLRPQGHRDRRSYELLWLLL